MALALGRKMLSISREVGWGEVKILVRDSKPVRVIAPISKEWLLTTPKEVAAP
jgi:hypothetical protein